MSTRSPRSDTLCVVVCCYTVERWSLLVRGIEEAIGQLVDGDELTVVVDHNTELRDRLRERYPATGRMRVVENRERRGLSGARNTALAGTAADVMVYLDDDAVLSPGALESVRTGLADSRVVALGGAVVAEWEGAAAGEGRPPTWFPDEFGWVVGCDYRGLPADGATIRNPIGAAMAVRRAALAEIGGFDERLGRTAELPAGCEETLMGIALLRRDPAAVIRRSGRFAVSHSVPRSRARLRYFLSRCHHEGRSKAMLRQIAGASDAFSSESVYLSRTIPSGAVRYLGQAARGDLVGVGRLCAMVLGVLATGVGLIAGMAQNVGPRRSGSATAVTAGAARTRGPVTYGDFVSVVVCTVGRQLLLDTVEAVLAQDYPNFEFIVVDNRPGNGQTADLLADLDDPRLRIVTEAKPGISTARNRGAHEASGAVIAFTDDDARPATDWLSRLVRRFADDPTGTIGLVTGRVLSTEDPSAVQEWFEDAKIFDKGKTPTYWNSADVSVLADIAEPGERNVFFPYTAGQFGSGNNMAFAAEAMIDTGGFDERLGTGTPTRGGEDLDIYRTAVWHGWSVFYDPHAVVFHYHRDNFSDLRSQWFGYGTGLAASLTKALTNGHAVAVASRVPAGLHLLLTPSSERNQTFPDNWPRELRAIEVLGLLVGPFLYLRSSLRERSRSTIR